MLSFFKLIFFPWHSHGLQLHKNVKLYIHNSITGNVYFNFQVPINLHFAPTSCGPQPLLFYLNTPLLHNYSVNRGYHSLLTRLFSVLKSRYTMLTIYYQDELHSNPILLSFPRWNQLQIKKLNISRSLMCNQTQKL